jgi:hypothetical protein
MFVGMGSVLLVRIVLVVLRIVVGERLGLLVKEVRLERLGKVEVLDREELLGKVEVLGREVLLGLLEKVELGGRVMKG